MNFRGLPSTTDQSGAAAYAAKVRADRRAFVGGLTARAALLAGGGGHSCPVCWRSFQSRASLSAHRLVHLGRTTCPLCHRFLSRRADVRRHLHMSHGMARDQARALLLDTERDQARALLLDTERAP